MKIYPAIDIFEGKAVRLKRGDYAQMTVYSDDPVSVAKDFEKTGVTNLHVVDLEGARAGEPRNFDVIAKIASQTELAVQVGGGIRTADDIEMYLNAGIGRVILGTTAVTEPWFLRDMAQQHGEAIAVGADIKDGLIAIKGWTELSNMEMLDFCREVIKIGVTTIICTDISKDGMQKGPNVELYRTLKNKFPIKLVASGGISSLDDLKKLSEVGISGAIIGKALYEGTIDLKAAVAVVG